MAWLIDLKGEERNGREREKEEQREREYEHVNTAAETVSEDYYYYTLCLNMWLKCNVKISS